MTRIHLADGNTVVARENVIEALPNIAGNLRFIGFDGPSGSVAVNMNNITYMEVIDDDEE